MLAPIPSIDYSVFNIQETYIHQASQFLAMIGKNYLPDEADDSNANLGFDSNRIIGRSLSNGFSIQLDILNWSLQVGEDSILIAGKTKKDLFDWTKQQLTKHGLDPEKLVYISHYEVPEHALDNDQKFIPLSKEVSEAWVSLRGNATIVLNELNELLGLDSEIRIWPHHFDTGTYYALGQDIAIGAGWAMADSLVDIPYFYLYGWNKDNPIRYDNLPTLSIGRWLVNDHWQGVVVDINDLTLLGTANIEQMKNFLNTTLNFLRPQLT